MTKLTIEIDANFPDEPEGYDQIYDSFHRDLLAAGEVVNTALRAFYSERCREVSSAALRADPDGNWMRARGLLGLAERFLHRSNRKRTPLEEKRRQTRERVRRYRERKRQG